MAIPYRLLASLAAVLAVPSAYAAGRATLTGKILFESGQPAAHSTVIVYSAGVKTGYSTYCPTCYPDCGKRTLTDDKGAFTIDGLNTDLTFRLLVVRDGYEPLFVPNIDPLTSMPTATLKPRAPVADPSRVVKGRVVDTSGGPLRDAIVQTGGVAEADGRRIVGSPDGLEPLAVSDAQGDFEIAYSKPAISMVLMVEARGMAPRKILKAPTGIDRQTIVLDDGALVRGRLLQNGKPVAGAEMALFSTNHFNGNGYEEIRVGTGDDGTFAFTNVSTPVDWYLYAKMDSLAARGAVQPVKIKTAKDHEEIDLGDLPVNSGHSVRGKVTLPDGKPLPAGMRVILTPACRNCAAETAYDDPPRTIFARIFGLRDSQTAVLGPDGRFEFHGLPTGPFSLTAAVKGYQLAGGYSTLRPLDPIDDAQWKHSEDFNNQSLRLSSTIEIRVEKDLNDIEIRLEPAPPRQ